MLPQDSFLNPNAVKLYLILFGSLISKPDLFAAHRDPIFYCEHKSGMCVKGTCKLLDVPRQVFPHCSGDCSWILLMLEWELGRTLRGRYQFEKWGFFPCFLGSLSTRSLPAVSPTGPVKEGSTVLYVHSCPPPGPVAILWETHSNFPLQSAWPHGSWIDSHSWISLPETLGCHGVPQLIS